MSDSEQRINSGSNRGKGLAIFLGGVLISFAVVSGAYTNGGRYEFTLTNLKSNLGIASTPTPTPSPRHRTQQTKKENYVYGN